MADHNFLTDTYNFNTAILDECKRHISEIILPSEPVSQFDDVDTVSRMEINAVNRALDDVSQVFEGQANSYFQARQGICAADINYAAKQTGQIDDIEKLISALNGMINVMNVSCKSGSAFLDRSISGNLAANIIIFKIRDYLIIDENGKKTYDWQKISGLVDKEFFTDEDMMLFTNLIDSMTIDNADGTTSFSEDFVRFCECFYVCVDFDLHDMVPDEYVKKYFGDKLGTPGYETPMKCLLSKEGLNMMLNSGRSIGTEMGRAIKEQRASGYMKMENLLGLIDVSGMREGTAKKYADIGALSAILTYYREHGSSNNRNMVADYIEQVTSVEYRYDVKLFVDSNGQPMSISINGSEYKDMFEHNWNESLEKYEWTQKYSPYEMILNHAGEVVNGSASKECRTISIDEEIGFDIGYDKIEIINSRDLYDDKGKSNASFHNDIVTFESYSVSSNSNGNDEITALINNLKEEDSYLVELIEKLKQDPSSIDEKGWEKVASIIGDGFKEIPPVKAVSSATQTVKKVVPGIELASELENLKLNNKKVDKVISSLKSYDAYEKGLDRIDRISQALCIQSCRIVTRHDNYGDELGFSVSLQNISYDEQILKKLVDKYNADERHSTKLDYNDVKYALDNGNIDKGGVVDTLSSYIEVTTN